MAAPVKIFVSHSQYDPNRQFLSEVLKKTDVDPVLMEFESIAPRPWWKPIRERVAASVATFVLLSKTIEERLHTQNWIDFEVGLSCAEGKQVWVFEPQGQEIEFVVPFCTYYCIYDPTEPNAAEIERLKWYIDMYAGETSAKTLWAEPSATCPSN